MAKSFKGGIHPPYHKNLTKDKEIRTASEPKEVVLPLSQHTGTICTPLVVVGDTVKVGQKIGDSDKLISAPIHASISGKVKAIEPRLHPSGSKILSIVIESDGQNTVHESIAPFPPLEKLTREEIRKIVRNAGIVGMGGAAFPTHVKLSPPPEKKISHIIINGSECEPYLTCDHRLMLEEPEKIILGTKAIMKAAGAINGIIAIEDNKPDVIKIMQKLIKGTLNLKVIIVKTKYPQGGEKQLIKAILNKEVPSGGLPMDVGVVVNNVGTAAQIAKTLLTGMPLIDRIVTITGSGVKNPSNLRVKIGTSIDFALQECGGLQGETGKIMFGGPMMGLAQTSVDVPITKYNNGVIVLSRKEVTILRDDPCMRCGKCIEACPIGLMPNFLGDAGQTSNWKRAKELSVKDCIECGCCTYVCGSERLLVHYIKLAKNALQNKLEKRKTK
ncbi:MAG: electron transport complex subunit RsxC [Candidatus Saganbacteria bacterium]|nr:electron transport complex subunit RsxC [Candidatus Saganbacteria bacterium]